MTVDELTRKASPDLNRRLQSVDRGSGPAVEAPGVHLDVVFGEACGGVVGEVAAGGGEGVVDGWGGDVGGCDVVGWGRGRVGGWEGGRESCEEEEGEEEGGETREGRDVHGWFDGWFVSSLMSISIGWA
ncbi:hypothetical protein LTR01_001167 [Friedmanniomyces endolithicus]|nr:hypothetical protein LTR01_001167 [Friedmanniomyces endolithicus]